MSERARLGLTETSAERVWDLLVEHAGAPERDRGAFVQYLTDSVPSGHEYRFIGLLGFGGKLHYSRARGAWISCYPEDENDERRAIINRVNGELSIDRVRKLDSALGSSVPPHQPGPS